MTAKQEIPSESRHQVVNQLKELKSNIILTGSILGVPEAYLREYQKECSDKLITVTEMHEIRTQKGALDELDLQFYIETSLALNLCEQLLKKENIPKNLTSLKNALNNECTNFLFGMDKIYRNQYHKGMILKSLLDKINGKMEWEWLVMDFDNPISNAEIVQNCMYSFMTHSEISPSKVILSAYDEKLGGCAHYYDFQILHFSEEISYRQLQKEALKILHQLYKNWNHIYTIEKILSSKELEDFYTENNCTPQAFMNGIHQFYQAYQSIDRMSCIIENSELLNYMKEYIINNKNTEKKKSKLYI